MARLYELLADCADEAIEKMAENGSLPPGRNGPWNDPETPVRNTGHWLLTFLNAYESSNEDRYRSASDRAVEYLLSQEARPYEQTFHHRHVSSQDRCNGLIGQAWSIEALVAAGETLDREELLHLAESVFLLHPFDERLAAWKIVDIDGTVIGFDMTFNHQLWFAAVGALLAQQPNTNPEVERRVRRFMDELKANTQLYESGIIRHLLKPDFNIPKYTTVFFDGIRRGTAHKMILGQLRSMATRGGESSSKDEWHERAIGYHSFNMYAFALLYERFPSHDFWNSRVFDRALSFATGDGFAAQLDGNPYGYPYNCSGIEMAYVLEVFGENNRDAQREWIDRQLALHYDPRGKMLSKNTADANTLTARLYESTRVSDIAISVPQA